jgi:hypothetical protein
MVKSKNKRAPEEPAEEPRQEKKPVERMTKAELLAEVKALQAKESEKEEGKLSCLPVLLA